MPANRGSSPPFATRTGRALDMLERFLIFLTRVIAEAVLQRPTGRF